MAKIEGECSLGRNYKFYLEVTESSVGSSSSTVEVRSYVTNGDHRFNSSGWWFTCTVGTKTISSKRGINIATNYTEFWETCGPLTWGTDTGSGTSMVFTFTDVPVGKVNISYRIYKDRAYTSVDPGEMTASGDFYTTPNTTDVTTYLLVNSSNYLEIMSAGHMRQPTWSESGGQDDIVWHDQWAGSWTRAGITYPWAFGGTHSNASLDDIWNTHTYNERNNNIAAFRYYPRIYIKYNANGGSSTPATQTKYIGAELSLAGAISRTGYTFLGWSTNSAATTASYGAGMYLAWEAWNSISATATNSGWSSTIPAHDGNTITLYAIWSKNSYWNDINAYQPRSTAQSGLVFDLTTSDGSKWTNLTNEPDGFTKPYGTVATISNIRPNIAGAHYTKNNVTGTNASSFSWTFTTDSWVCELYSDWNEYTLTANPNGGKLVGSNFGSDAGTTNSHGVTVTYSLSNYYNLGVASKDNDTATRTVTFNANGGSCSTNSLNSTATNTYSFKGWYTATSGGTQVYGSNGVCIAGTSYWNANNGWCYSNNLTIYAQFNSSTGTFSAITLPTPTRSGYTFKGWGESISATSGVTGSYTPAKTLTLYAVWEETKPTNVTISSPSSTSSTINLTWSCTGINVTYDLRYRKVGATDWILVNCNKDTSYTITGLTSGTEYETFVTATNGGGPQGSAIITVHTISDQATGRMKIDGHWTQGMLYTKINNKWEKVIKSYIKKDGKWVETINK